MNDHFYNVGHHSWPINGTPWCARFILWSFGNAVLGMRAYLYNFLPTKPCSFDFVSFASVLAFVVFVVFFVFINETIIQIPLLPGFPRWMHILAPCCIGTTRRIIFHVFFSSSHPRNALFCFFFLFSSILITFVSGHCNDIFCHLFLMLL